MKYMSDMKPITMKMRPVVGTKLFLFHFNFNWFSVFIFSKEQENTVNVQDGVSTWESRVISVASGLMYPLQCSHRPRALVI